MGKAQVTLLIAQTTNANDWTEHAGTPVLSGIGCNDRIARYGAVNEGQRSDVLDAAAAMILEVSSRDFQAQSVAVNPPST